MKKSKAARIAGFVGALGVSAVLVGYAATGTGAYFTDSHSGEIDAGTGHVKVAVSPGDLKLHFTDLLPGEFTTKTVDYTAQGTSSEDIWLVFPKDGSADAFTGVPNGGPTPLGRYGHFALDSTGGANFTSYNLARSNNASSADSCPINTNGWGGSNAQAADPSETVLFCAPADAILLQSNMAPGASGHANLTFGFTKLLTAPQDAPENKVVNFTIVATQHGVRPDDPNN